MIQYTCKLLWSAPITAKIGLAVIALNVVAALFAPVLAPHGEAEIVGDVWVGGFWAEDFDERSEFILLGTDQIGRDLFSRLIYGARNTIAIAFVTTLLSFATGIAGGFLAATVGGLLDQILSRIIDIIMAFPTLILALMVLSVLGTSIPVLIVVIALLDSTRVYRISRAIAMDVEVMDFVEVAKLRGEGQWWVMHREILPNTLAPLAAEFGLRFCFVFLFIAALSFLGLGVQPPTADWGSMVRENAAGISYGIITPLLPAATIAILTIGVNLIVDWVVQKTSGIREIT